jgi:mono/diheme cytochrome c family protein
MRGFIFGVVFTVLVILLVVFCTIHFGLFPLGADNPPGKVERTLANSAMDEYVDRHMPEQKENPFQPTSDNLTEGAHIYEKHCSMCHGGAANKISPMRTKFSPPVPQIINRIPHDEDGHLWWVTKHGIRMTGMPSWDGVLTDEQMWKTILFIKHSNALPPDVQMAWEEIATPAPTTEPAQQATPPTPKPPSKH